MCCLFFRRNCCRCCPRPIPPFPPTPIPPVPSIPITNVGARFNLLSATDVASGSVIPLTNTAFNNAIGFISNNNGSISLNGEGLYLVNYTVNAANTSDTNSNLTVLFNVNGATDTSASASTNVGAGENGSVSSSSLIFVSQNSTTTVSLSVTSDETLPLLPNLVVTKLS